MKRIVKGHDERKNEIIDTAAALFVSKGYEACSVNDILAEIGIAKGTFYHYFKSKEEVLDAVIKKEVDKTLARVARAAEDAGLSPDEKLFHIFLSLRAESPEADMLIREMHKPGNALLHQKSLAASLNGVLPLLTRVVEEGNQTGVFRCAYPEQYMQIFFVSSVTLLDEGIFQTEPHKAQRLFEALITMLEGMCSVKEKSFLEKAAEHWKF